MTDLLDLAARVEAAGADEQYQMLAMAFDAVFPEHELQGTPHIEWKHEYRAFRNMLAAEAYESAAMMLVPDGYAFGCGHGTDLERFPGWAWCGKDEGAYIFAETPALALTAACLRAHHAREAQDAE